MAFCSNCGKALLNDAEICRNCGTEVKVEKSSEKEKKVEDKGKNKKAKKISHQIRLILVLLIWSGIIFMIIYLYKTLEIPNISEIISVFKSRFR
ncbi:zinc-ribbon domain-containing protein [archaeon AH-315-M20]|nr:zinc-ribbon domain-containing protein [archaeon AH-315-M20]